MQKTARVPLHCFVPDPEQPRKLFDAGEIVALSENLKAIGQQVPVIGFQDEGKVVLVDGERRVRAAQIAGIAELMAVVLSERPSKAQLRIIQNSVDSKRVQLTPMERSNLLAEIQKETGWTVNELVTQLSMKQAIVSKLLAYQKLAPEVQAMLHTGGLSMEHAYLISQVDGMAAQVEMLKESANMSRESLRGKVKSNGQPKPKTKRAVFMLSGGMTIAVNGREADLEEIVEGLMTLVKELRKGISQGLTVSSAERVLKDKAKV